jgi:hypothetical protein
VIKIVVFDCLILWPGQFFTAGDAPAETGSGEQTSAETVAGSYCLFLARKHLFGLAEGRAISRTSLKQIAAKRLKTSFICWLGYV